MDIINVLTEVTRRMNQMGITYVIGGSVATVVNGCSSIRPNDIDVILKNAVDVEKVAFLFEDFLSESQGIESTDRSDWISTRSQPTINFEDPFHNRWTFARFLFKGIKVEAGNIQPTDDFEYVPGTGIWESGPAIWPYIEQVKIEDVVIPVLPLEIQLETNLNRKLEDRTVNIIDVLKREGYDSELLKFSLSRENYLHIIKRIKK